MTEFEMMKIAFKRTEENFIVTQWKDGSALIELLTFEENIEFWFNTSGKLQRIHYA